MLPPFQYWISGPAIYLAGSFAFAVIVGLIGIRWMVSDRRFRSLIAIAVVLSALAWRTAAKQEQTADNLVVN